MRLFFEHNTAPYYFLIAELIAIICFGAVSFSAFRNVITLHKARHLGACIYNRDRKKSYKIKALPCPHCKTTFRTPLKIKDGKNFGMEFTCPHCSFRATIPVADILNRIDENYEPKK